MGSIAGARCLVLDIGHAQRAPTRPGAFYETIVLATFYEIINNRKEISLR
jgi:hypothetical protein